MTRIKMHISKVKLPFYPPCEVKYRLQNGVSTLCYSTKYGRVWLFCFCFLVVVATVDVAVEEMERETCKERERKRERWAVERERVSCIKFFGFRNKYGMY